MQEEDQRLELTSQLDPNVPSAYEMELYDLSPQRMVGSPVRVSNVSWDVGKKNKGQKTFLVGTLSVNITIHWKCSSNLDLKYIPGCSLLRWHRV